MMKFRWLRRVAGVSVVVLAACAVQPRPVKGGKASRDPEVQTAELPGASGEESEAIFQIGGYHWSIREARPRTSAHLRSAWELGQVLSFAKVIQGNDLSVIDPLAWPDDPQSILVVQIRGGGAGDWSARCVRADGSTEVPVPPHRLEWDAESQSALIPLSKIFGARGQAHDPASLCHLQVSLDSRAADPVQLSLRVLGGLPAPEPTERKDHGWNVGGLIREEVWKNEGFRSLVLRIAAPSTISVLSRLVLSGAAENQQFLYTVAAGAVVQARVILDSRVSEWRPLPLDVRWTPGAVLRLEYRLAPAPGVSVCESMFRVNVGWGRFSIPLRVASRQFAGKVSWDVVVSEDPPAVDGAPPRHSRKAELQRADDLLGIPQGSSPFDCQGWVS